MVESSAIGAIRSSQSPAWLVFAVFFALAAAAASVGALVGPGAWYAALHKPSWNPPNWLFGPVWTVLYIMIAAAGALAYRAGADRFTIAVWGAQLVLNAAWTWLFFGLHRPDWALVEIAALLAAIALFAVRAWPYSRLSAVLFMPYLGWVAFATALNLTLWRLN